MKIINYDQVYMILKTFFKKVSPKYTFSKKLFNKVFFLILNII